MCALFRRRKTSVEEEEERSINLILYGFMEKISYTRGMNGKE